MSRRDLHKALLCTVLMEPWNSLISIFWSGFANVFAICQFFRKCCQNVAEILLSFDEIDLLDFAKMQVRPWRLITA